MLPLSATNSQTFWSQFAPHAILKMDVAIQANHGLSNTLADNATQCGVENTYAFVERCNVSTVSRMLNHMFGSHFLEGENVSDTGLIGDCAI